MLFENGESFWREDTPDENAHRIAHVSAQADFVFLKLLQMSNGIGMQLGKKETGEFYVDIFPDEMIFNSHFERFLYFFIKKEPGNSKF